nr:polycomb protein pho [Quercus suber]
MRDQVAASILRPTAFEELVIRYIWIVEIQIYLSYQRRPVSRQITSDPAHSGSHLSHQLDLQYVQPEWISSGSQGPLEPYDWNTTSAPSPPTRQDRRSEDRSQLSHIESARCQHRSNRSLPYSVNHDNDGRPLIGFGSATHINTTTAKGHICEHCSQCFAQSYLLKRHLRRHDPSFPCLEERCGYVAQYKKDLERHRLARHGPYPVQDEPSFCPYTGCKYAQELGVGSFRKDNLRRHIVSHGRRLRHTSASNAL